jgi:CRISPR-associated protein Csd2
MADLQRRYDFVLLFDVRDGNPNGDPDAGNLPRVDAVSGHGIVTDVSLKRKVRNFVGLVKDDAPPFGIYIKEHGVLERIHRDAYIATGSGGDLDSKKEGKRTGGEAVGKARVWMCQNFFDVRTFGAVMSTGINCGQVRGPVQMTFGRSIEPITSLEYAITRMAVATEKEATEQGGDNRTMGRKSTVPYGLYRSHGFVSAFLAKQTGFGDDDLALLWQALGGMFDQDRSAARGEMATRGLYVFEHESQLGNAPAYSLFDRLTVDRRAGAADVARGFADYEVLFDGQSVEIGAAVPAQAGVTLRRLA